MFLAFVAVAAAAAAAAGLLLVDINYFLFCFIPPPQALIATFPSSFLSLS